MPNDPPWLPMEAEARPIVEELAQATEAACSLDGETSWVCRKHLREAIAAAESRGRAEEREAALAEVETEYATETRLYDRCREFMDDRGAREHLYCSQVLSKCAAVLRLSSASGRPRAAPPKSYEAGLAAGRAEEREACAKVAERDGYARSRIVARAIRARGSADQTTEQLGPPGPTPSDPEKGAPK